MSKGLRRYGFWLLLAAPGLWWTAAYGLERIYYGEYVHRTGLASVVLLIVTLAVTPLARVLPRYSVLAWLRRARRNLGVASFGYAALHAIAYCVRKPLDRIVDDALTAGFATGWVAMLVIAALAVTSHDLAVKRLGRSWRTLHRFVHLATALTVAHWVLTAFDPTQAWVCAAIILAIQSLRLLPKGIVSRRLRSTPR